MQANEFEKQVQQKMDELSFTPSAPVWQNVEKEIRRKKQKRRMLLWLPIFALLLTGGIVWLSLSTEKEKSDVEFNTAGIQNSELNNQPSVTEESKERTLKEENTSPKYQQQKTDYNNNTRGFNGTTNTRALHQKYLNKKSTYNTTQNIVSKKPSALSRTNQPNTTLTNNSIEQLIASSDTKPQVDKKETSNAENSSQVINHTTNSVAIKTIQPELKVDSVQKINEDSVKKLLLKDSIQSKDTAANKIEIKKKIASAKWMLTPVLQTGIAGITKKGGLYNGARYSDPLLNSGGGTVADNSISRPKNNLGISLGLLAQKQITKRLQFETGLQYSFLSNTVDVGRRRRIDTVVSNQYGITRVTQYYEKSAENNFNNKYHFISLPVALNLKLFTNTPVFVHTGIAIQYMISSNGLAYSSQNRIYYHDKKAFNKAQFSTDLGIYYQLACNKKTLTVGPNVQYNWTRLQKDNSPYQHLFAAGVRATLGLSN
jgi:hypothetical protein